MKLFVIEIFIWPSELHTNQQNRNAKCVHTHIVQSVIQGQSAFSPSPPPPLEQNLLTQKHQVVSGASPVDLMQLIIGLLPVLQSKEQGQAMKEKLRAKRVW